MDDNSAQTDQRADARTYFAAERTLLAWVRTGLAMMGFGFVVARFGLFLRELAVVGGGPPEQPHSVSLWLGTTLVLLGAGASLWAALMHWGTIRDLDRGKALRFSPFSMGIFVAVLLGCIGLATAFYLAIGWNGPR